MNNREISLNTQKTPDSGHVSQDPKSDNSSNQSSPEALTSTKNRCALSVTAVSQGYDDDDVRFHTLCQTCICGAGGYFSAVAAC